MLIRCEGAPAVLRISSITLPVCILISLMYGVSCGETTMATPDALSLLCGVRDVKLSSFMFLTGVK